MKVITEAVLVTLMLFGTFYVAFLLFEKTEKSDTEAEKLQLEIQHLKYQVGIDSLRYDLELNFYERRKNNEH